MHDNPVEALTWLYKDGAWVKLTIGGAVTPENAKDLMAALEPVIEAVLNPAGRPIVDRTP